MDVIGLDSSTFNEVADETRAAGVLLVVVIAAAVGVEEEKEEEVGKLPGRDATAPADDDDDDELEINEGVGAPSRCPDPPKVLNTFT